MLRESGQTLLFLIPTFDSTIYLHPISMSHAVLNKGVRKLSANGFGAECLEKHTQHSLCFQK
jgi:hypothetical protein